MDGSLRKGFTVAQLVPDHGSIGEAITGFAIAQGAVLSTEAHRVLNQFLDKAIAEAVTGYGLQHEQLLSHQETERMGVLAHELRNLISTASQNQKPRSQAVWSAAEAEFSAPSVTCLSRSGSRQAVQWSTARAMRHASPDASPHF